MITVTVDTDMTQLCYRGARYEQHHTWESAAIKYFQKQLEREQRRAKETARDKAKQATAVS